MTDTEIIDSLRETNDRMRKYLSRIRKTYNIVEAHFLAEDALTGGVVDSVTIERLPEIVPAPEYDR